jgi:membrane protease YdiL (CAAX protease family)
LNEDDLTQADGFAGVADEQPPETQPASRRVSRLRWWIHLLLIGGYFTPLLFLRRPLGPALTHTPRGLVIVCLVDLAFFAIVFGLAWLASRASRQQLFLSWRPGWWVVPLGVAYSIAIRVAVAMITVVITVVLLTTVFDQHQVREFWRSAAPDVTSIVSITAARSDPVYAWLLVSLVSFVSAGLREELWRAGTLAGMRALWPRAFGSRFGQVVAITVIAVAFGFGHFRMGVLGASMAGMLGFFLGLIIILHRSIWPAVIAHGSFDALTFAMLAWLPVTAQPLH